MNYSLDEVCTGKEIQALTGLVIDFVLLPFYYAECHGLYYYLKVCLR